MLISSKQCSKARKRNKRNTNKKGRVKKKQKGRIKAVITCRQNDIYTKIPGNLYNKKSSRTNKGIQQGHRIQMNMQNPIVFPYVSNMYMDTEF